MPIRGLASAALVSSLLAGDLVVLTLFLNPEASLRKDWLPLLGSLFLPYALLGALLFALLGFLGRLVRGRRGRPIVPGLPFFTPFAMLSVLITGLLFWGNLWHYRFSIPVAFVEGLAGSGVCLT